MINSEFTEEDTSSMKSPIWEHGTKYKGPNGEKRWRCGLCPGFPKNYNVSKATTNAVEHLREVHGIKLQLSNPVKLENQSTLDSIVQLFNPIVFRKLLVEWVVERRHSFNEIESPALRRIFEYLNPRSTKAFISANTMRADIIRYLEKSKTTIIEILHVAKSRIHLSFDLWTSPNYKAMLAITGHWTDANFEAKSALLAIREVLGVHSGVNIANVVYEVAQEFLFDNRIGYFVGDNATNNDTAIEHLNRRLEADYKNGVELAEHRLRCFGHILNLVVKKLIFGPTQLELHELGEDVDPETISKKWRACGAIGKCHNVVKFIRHSPQRRQVFLSISLDELNAAVAKIPVMDNDTRWGSMMTMVEVALQQRQRIDEYCKLVDDLLPDRLSESDWCDLKNVTSYCQQFY
jgi:hypothetical protein